MKVLKIISLLSIVIVLLWSCATVDYVGESYPQTANIDIYYSYENVKNNYKKIGYAVGYKTDYDTIINQIIAEAKTNGADAIIITGIDVEIGDESKTKKVTAELLKYFD